MHGLRWLFSLQGRVARAPYVVCGLVLMLAKFGVDAALCAHFGLHWSPLFYWLTLPVAVGARAETAGLWWIGLISVPFAWVGIALSARRCRDAGVNPWNVALFVVPFVKLVFFALLAIVPTATGRNSRAPEATDVGPRVPSVVAAVVAAIATAFLVWLGPKLFGRYGNSLFLGAPFLQGMLVALQLRRRELAPVLVALCVSMLCSGGILLALAWEGLVCIAMVAPLALVMGMLGVALVRGCTPVRTRWVAPSLLVVPLGALVEPHALPPPSVYEATTEVIVAAPRETVWRCLVEFSELPPPTELPFRLGVAHPVHATIEGRGPGAVRRCSFNTGDFVEPIEVWDEPRLLRFSVDDCPPPMVEWNPLHDEVDAEHLHDTFVAHRGQFELFDRGDGTTRLAGTTWYSHGLWPETYWSFWSDWLVHTIHRRVLDHIARSAEADRKR